MPSQTHHDWFESPLPTLYTVPTYIQFAAIESICHNFYQDNFKTESQFCVATYSEPLQSVLQTPGQNKYIPCKYIKIAVLHVHLFAFIFLILIVSKRENNKIKNVKQSLINEYII